MDFIIRKPRIKFTIKLAGVAIEVNALYRQTMQFCNEYLTNETPTCSVRVSASDIRQERKISTLNAVESGSRKIYYSNQYLETLALCRKVMAELLNQNIVLFHGAVMAVGEKAYLFTAKSGTGKTTHCNLWLKNVPNCHILNGDKPLLLFKNDKVFVCGGPWQGKEKYGVNEILPLEAICLLERDKENHAEKTNLKNCLDEIVSQTHIPNGVGDFKKAIDLINRLSSVNFYRVGCNMENDAALTVYNKIANKN